MVAHVDSLPVVLEGLTGFHRRAQAIKDAAARLTQRLTTAVCQYSDPPRRTHPATHSKHRE